MKPTPARPERPDDVDPGRLVFVNADEIDLPLAYAVGAALTDCGVWCTFPRTDGSPAELREDLEQKLLDCDALMLIYGSTKVSWVSEQLRRSRKVMYRRKSPLPAIGLFEGPPETKEELDLMIPNLRVIKSRSGLNRDALHHFLDAFRPERSQRPGAPGNGAHGVRRPSPFHTESRRSR